MELLERVVKRKQTYKRGEILFRHGDQTEYVFALRSGSVKTYVTTEDNREQVTGFHVAGELLGLSALGCGEYTTDARALETTSVCKVELERLDEIGKRIPTLQFEMMKIMGGQIRHDEELMLLLGKRSAEERLAKYLLSLSDRFARRNYSATDFRLSMSRQDIGNYLGIAEETVCRLFARFQEEKLIEFDRRQVRLVDVEALRGIAHVAPRC
jgi:CRP/FNR family transcriptional regulator